MAEKQLKNMNETYFEWWALELKEIGLIKEIQHQPEKFILENPLPVFYEHKYKVKEPLFKSFNLFQGITYTCDYRLVFDIKLLNKLFGVFMDDMVILKDNNIETGNVYQNTLFYSTEISLKFKDDSNKLETIEMFFDVKPPSSALRYSGSLGSSRDFKFNQRMTYNKHNIYVNKVVPADGKNCLFNKTFIPKRYLYTDGGNQIRKKKSHLDYSKTLENYLTTKNIL